MHETNSVRDDELFALLYQTGHAMARARDKELKEVGVSMIQGAVLFCLTTFDEPPTPSDMSRWLFRQPNTVLMLLRQMQRHGLVKTRKDRRIRNLVRVTMTEKGRQTYSLVRQRDAEIGKTLSCLSPEERAMLRTCLEKLRRKSLQGLGIEGILPYPTETTLDCR